MVKGYFHISKIVGCLMMLLAMVSCVNEEMPDMPLSKSLSLQVFTSDIALTRTTPGVDNLNENRFVSLDYYFFASNNDENTLLLHKSEGNRVASGNTTLGNGSHTYNATLTDEDIRAIFGSADATTGDCYVYVLANLLSSTRTAINNLGSSATLGGIKKVSFQDTNISANAVQECFVMFGGGSVSLTTDASTEVRTIGGSPIKVTRDAAKIVLSVQEVTDVVEVEDGQGNVQRWKSLPGQMYVMFYNGVNKSNVHSQINEGLHYEPTVGDNCYFSLNNTAVGATNPWRKMNPESASYPNKNLTHDYPIYSYLADWRENYGNIDRPSYMILVMPWQQIDSDDNPIGVPRATYYQLQTSTTDTYYENYFYRINIKLIGVLGSFELPEPTELPVSTYMIVPWGEKDIDATMREPIYLIVESNHYTMNNTSSGSVPYISSHDLDRAYVKEVKFINKGTFESITRTNPNTDGLNTTYTVNTYTNPNLSESFQVSTADGKVTLTHNISPNQYTRYDVTVVIRNEKGLSEEIVFTIYPAIYVSIETGGDTFVNGRFVHVQGAAGTGTGANMPWYGHDGYNWYEDNARNTNNNRWSDNFYITAGYGSLRFNLGTNNVTNQSLTRITVTSFNEDDSKYTVTKNNTSTQYTYKITDPRVVNTSINGNLTNYIVTAEANRTNYNLHTASWANKNAIMTGSSSSDAIAPEFLICSGWGRTQGENAQSFTTFERRCATYQEAGYPAGRWRIPTEAELAYIFKLQQLGVIPNLFQVTNGNAYWASSGWAINGYNNGVCSFTNSPSVNGGNTAGVRCVYDIWYWGEEKMSANEYHAEP